MSDVKQIRTREDIDDMYLWDLSKIYSDEKDWESDMEWVEERIGDLSDFRGKLNGPGPIAEMMISSDEISRILEKVFTYAHLKHDENLKTTRYQELHDRSMDLMIKLGTETSFIIPEILKLPEEKLYSLIDEEELQFAKVPLRDIIRKKDHFLSDKEEMLLAMAEDPLETAAKAFKMLNDADLTFPVIKDEKGNDVELSHGRYISFMVAEDRGVRKRAFDAMYSTYRDHRNTFAALLEGDLKKRTFSARARRYDSALIQSLDSDEITEDVYDSLIKAVRSHLPSMHDYLDLRRKALDIDQVHMYDVYAPLVKDFDRHIPYEEAFDIVMEALLPLGDEVGTILEEARNNRWIDVYENRGKRSGAYSSGCYDSSPYILLNYEGKVNDLFTLAHELGHSVHTYLSNSNQPHITADYRIFVAEVASTVNENLLMKYLSRIWTSDREKRYLVNHHLDSFKGTVFRQTMFAEFEKKVSEIVEDHKPLTADGLSGIYKDLNRDHFGPGTCLDEGIELEWARIPHFYYNFYVYKYATGFSAATAISRRIIDGQGNPESYLNMLRSGGSEPPLELLKGIGVDLSTPGPVDSGLELFDSLVRELSGFI